jgi:hypothetical protein
MAGTQNPYTVKKMRPDDFKSFNTLNELPTELKISPTGASTVYRLQKCSIFYPNFLAYVSSKIPILLYNHGTCINLGSKLKVEFLCQYIILSSKK